jgi:hypothetical protein
MTYQLPLFGNVSRPICMGCKQQRAILGQWAPARNLYLCRDCMARHSPPADVFVYHDNRIGVGLRQEREFAKEREQYHSRLHALEELDKGCIYTVADIDEHDNLPCMVDNDLFTLAHFGNGTGLGWQRPIDASGCRFDCPRCRNRLRYIVQAQREVGLFKARMHERTVYTASLPICDRCGEVHDHKTLSGDAVAYCQRCDDLNAVESLWNNRGIFAGDDDETILDRLQRAFPGLFERNVLPDLWFELKAKV